MCNNCATAPIEAPTTGTTPIPTNEGENISSENNYTSMKLLLFPSCI